MSETTNEDRMYPIEMTLQGARCCISIGKGVIKALGKPSHVSIKISDSHDSLSVFPCDEDDVMAFRVPLKLFTDHRCVMRINSKQFVHGIMRTNQMDTSKTYVLSGEFLEEKNTAVFSLVEGVSLRTQKRDGAVMNDFVREFFEDQPELLRRYERNEARYILQLPKNYDTISINFGIDKNEMKRLVIALAELDLTIDEWLCFKMKELILADRLSKEK